MEFSVLFGAVKIKGMSSLTVRLWILGWGLASFFSVEVELVEFTKWFLALLFFFFCSLWYRVLKWDQRSSTSLDAGPYNLSLFEFLLGSELSWKKKKRLSKKRYIINKCFTFYLLAFLKLDFREGWMAFEKEFIDFS